MLQIAEKAMKAKIRIFLRALEVPLYYETEPFKFQINKYVSAKGKQIKM